MRKREAAVKWTIGLRLALATFMLCPIPSIHNPKGREGKEIAKFCDQRCGCWSRL